MNADAQQRFAFQKAEHCRVPSATECAPPIIVNAVHQRSCRKYFSRAKVAHRAEARRVFHLRVARRTFRFIAQQPCRRHKPARLKAVCTEFVPCGGDAAQSLVIAQIIKLALVFRVKPRQKLVAQTFIRRAGTFMKIAVDGDFVTVCFQAPEP